MPQDVQLSVRMLPGGFDAADIDGLRATDAAGDAVREIVRGPIKDPVGRTRAGGDLPVGEPRRFWHYMIEGSRPLGIS